jgi:hypothetical protein
VDPLIASIVIALITTSPKIIAEVRKWRDDRRKGD